MAARLFLTAALLAYPAAAASQPQGKFCGTAMGLHMRMDFKDSAHFDVNITVDEQIYPCTNESFTFNAATGSISTNVRDAADCLHGGFKKHFDDPDTVFFSYDTEQDLVRFVVDTVTSILNRGACFLGTMVV
eukprot:CAMPEP_0204529914 /NCGR_PEP_ID=MMETSP0661-20131031/10329_1 /ASSEMBLY_ACC=CAM_ASM_000606 /TAXON_ID=109239 /ORGANISM="Alexandrium margalefi, Strain AMGDE01CS-322" /LENGTH=131 /DNA_ID=CAMNT_0051535969 /DNA_START=78 /DNA_END=473 /DNA_ORIENTATION=-